MTTPLPARIGGAEATHVFARSVLTKPTGFIAEYDFTLNPYSGCSFGCSYCYAAFFSPSQENRDAWGRWVRVKENAVLLLAKRKPGSLDGKRIYMSSVTDPYQPIERRLRLTRRLLDILAGQRSPDSPPLLADPPKPKLVVQTRSPDVVRDCDLLRRIEENGGRAQVNMTVTTDDEEVRRTFEPSCPSNAARLRAIAKVRAEGVAACVTMTPLLWASDPRAFADRLLATGVRKFIIQPFHYQRGKFVASTREQAVTLMTRKLNCDRAAFRERYAAHYGEARATLKAELESAGAELGEGKAGFSPPF